LRPQASRKRFRLSFRAGDHHRPIRKGTRHNDDALPSKEAELPENGAQQSRAGRPVPPSATNRKSDLFSKRRCVCRRTDIK
jgi:hypothetical protein